MVPFSSEHGFEFPNGLVASDLIPSCGLTAPLRDPEPRTGEISETCHFRCMESEPVVYLPQDLGTLGHSAPLNKISLTPAVW